MRKWKIKEIKAGRADNKRGVQELKESWLGPKRRGGVVDHMN